MGYLDEIENNISPDDVEIRELDFVPTFFDKLEYAWEDMGKGMKKWEEEFSRPLTDEGGLPLPTTPEPVKPKSEEVEEEDIKSDVSFWEGAKVTAKEAFDRLPLYSLQRKAKLDAAMNKKAEPDYYRRGVGVGTFNGRFHGVNMADLINDPNFDQEAFAGGSFEPLDLGEQNVFLTEEQWKNSEYFHPELKFPDGVWSAAAKILKERKEVELNRKAVMEKAPHNALSEVGYFLVGLGTEFADPVNVGMMMIPIVGEAKWLGALGKNKVIRRAVKGGIEGLVGSIPVEAIAYQQLKAEQADWTLEDSIFNVMVMGPLAGAGLRNVIGGVSDIRGAWRSIDNVLDEQYSKKTQQEREALTLKAFDDLENDKMITAEDFSDAQSIQKITPDDVVKTKDDIKKAVEEKEIEKEIEVEEQPSPFDPEETKEWDLYDEDGKEILDPNERAQMISDKSRDQVIEAAKPFTEEIDNHIKEAQERHKPSKQYVEEKFDDAVYSKYTSDIEPEHMETSRDSIYKIYNTPLEDIEKRNNYNKDKVLAEVDDLVRSTGLAPLYEYGGSYVNRLKTYDAMRNDFGYEFGKYFYGNYRPYIDDVMKIMKMNEGIYTKEWDIGEMNTPLNWAFPAKSWHFQTSETTPKYKIKPFNYGNVRKDNPFIPWSQKLGEYQEKGLAPTRGQRNIELRKAIKEQRIEKNKQIILDDEAAIEKLKALTKEHPEITARSRAAIHALEGKLTGADIKRLYESGEFDDLPDPKSFKTAADLVDAWTKEIDKVRDNTRLLVEDYILKPKVEEQKVINKQKETEVAAEIIETEKERIGTAIKNDLGNPKPEDNVYNQDVDIKENRSYTEEEFQEMDMSGEQTQLQEQMREASNELMDIKNTDGLTPEHIDELEQAFVKIREEYRTRDDGFKKTVYKALECI